jgi:NAD(P)-dependent dehydrogenase (short-subunit alcohol dehydrogenase family)
MDPLADRVAVVTGAASGIGRALTLELVGEGMQVHAVDVDQAGLESLASESDAIAVAALDVADTEACEAFAARVFDQHGCVHLLINNAGVIGRFAPIWDQDPDDWRWMFSVNVFGIANMLRAFVPRMREQGAASHIVNTASEAAFAARAYVGVYHASKHAVLALTESLAQELEFEGAPIRVSVLCPGGVNTRVLDSERNRPSDLEAPRPATSHAAALRASYATALADAMSPKDVAGVVIDGIKQERFYLLPHPDVAKLPQTRADAVAQDHYPRVNPRLAERLKR